MKKPTYFRKNFTPSLYLLNRKFKGQSTPLDYLRVVRDGLLPGRRLYPRLVLVMTTFCSLRCRDCNNLMARYEHPSHFEPKDLFYDLEDLLDGVDTLTELELIGGEPFIYPHLAKVIKKALSNKKILFVSLTTNGTVIPDEKMMKLLSDKRIRVEISDYGLANQKIDDLAEAFDYHGVRYDRNPDLSWVSPGDVTKRGKSREQLAQEYQQCFSFKYCNTILKGRVYHCSRAAHLTDLGYMDHPLDSYDIHRVRSRSQKRDDFKHYWLAPYTMACDYCDHALKKKVRAGIQEGSDAV